jgi:hypothetical protein
MQVVSTKHRYMKVCIIAPSVVHVQKITNAFNEWLLQDMNAFVYPSLINTDKTTTILDTNVHSNFQTPDVAHDQST